jgi:hypothetical protein
MALPLDDPVWDPENTRAEGLWYARNRLLIPPIMTDELTKNLVTKQPGPLCQSDPIAPSNNPRQRAGIRFLFQTLRCKAVPQNALLKSGSEIHLLAVRRSPTIIVSCISV